MQGLLLILCGAVIAASLFFGGGARRGLSSDVVPELLCLPLLCLVLPQAMTLLRRSPGPLVLMGLLFGAPLLHVVPLPPSLWGSLPGRDAILATYAAAGIDPPWRPLAMDAGQTWRALFALLPALSVFLAIVSLDRESRGRLVLLVIAVGVLSVPISMLQVLGGDENSYYFFAVTNIGAGVGFFANSNHFATFCFVLLPLAASVFAEADAKVRTTGLLILCGVAFVLLLGLSLSRSRTALILGFVAMAATLAFVLPDRLQGLVRRRGAVTLAAIAAVCLAPVVMGVGLLTILERFQTQNVAEDARWTVASTTWRAFMAYFPLGSGIGSFESVYPLYERPRDIIMETVNHAHNDWLELALEGGALALVGLVGWMLWLVVSTVRVSRSAPGMDERMARGAIVALWLLSLHSLWDYPMRTIALSVVAALCCALLQPPVPSLAPAKISWFGIRKKSHRRRRSKRTHRAMHGVGDEGKTIP